MHSRAANQSGCPGVRPARSAAVKLGRRAGLPDAALILAPPRWGYSAPKTSQPILCSDCSRLVLPTARAPQVVRDGEDDDRSGAQLVDEPIGEPPQNAARASRGAKGQMALASKYSEMNPIAAATSSSNAVPRPGSSPS